MNDFRDRMAQSATSFEVSPVESNTITQRSRRRAAPATAIRVGAVALVVAGGAFAIRELSSDTISTDSGDAATASASTPEGASATTPSTVGAYPPEPADGTEPTDNAEYLALMQSERERIHALPEVSDAELVFTDYQWSRYDANSPQAAALRFDDTYPYAVGTADGVVDDTPPLTLFEKAGDEWNPIAELNTDDYSSLQVGDAFYFVPSEVGYEVTPEKFALNRVDLNTGDTTPVELPAGFTDTPEPFSDNFDVVDEVFMARSDDRLLVQVVSFNVIKPSAIGLSDDWEVATDAARPRANQEASVYAFNWKCESDENANIDECERRFSIDELALTEAELDAIRDTTATVWAYSDEAWTKVDGDAGDRLASDVPLDIVGLDGGGPAPCYAFGPDGGVMSLYGGTTFSPWFQTDCGFVHEGRASMGYLDVIFQQDLDGAGWHGSSVANLADALGIASGTTSVEVVSALGTDSIGYDALIHNPRDEQDVVLNSGDYTLTLPADRYRDLTLVNNSTGESMSYEDGVSISTDTGKIVASVEDRAVGSESPEATSPTAPGTTTFDMAPDTTTFDIRTEGLSDAESVTFDGDWETIDYLNQRIVSAVLLPLGDNRVEVLNIDDLVGVAEGDGRLAQVSDVRRNGEQLILTVDVHRPNGPPDTVVLVGTPS